MFRKKIPNAPIDFRCCKDINDKWVTPEQGLPDTDREVFVIIESYNCYINKNQRLISKSHFRPSIGWIRTGDDVIAWKEIDCETKRLLTL